MPADFIIGQGNTEPIFARQIIDSTGSPVNLTGASIQLIVRSLTSPAPLTLTGIVQIFDAPNGKLQWHPSAQDTASAGQFMGKWRITYANGEIQDYPTDGYEWILIEQNLSSPGGQYLVSLPDVKDYLNASGISHKSDAKLLRFINAATPIIENIVGPVIVRTFEEWHDGGNTWISLRRTPSTALGTTPVLTLQACSEYMGPIEWPLAIIASPDQGQLYSCMLDAPLGRIVRRTAGGGVQAFPHAPQAVHVIYQAGQQTVPANVQEATLEAIRQHYQTTMPTGTGSRTLADAAEPSGPGPAFAQLVDRIARQSLAPMRRYPSLA